MTHIKILALALLACATLPSCQHAGHSKPPDSLTVDHWLDTQSPAPVFPELTDPRIRPARLDNYTRSSLRYGIAFSGGGTRSAGATLGQLRMLEKLGWMDDIHYMAAISGGSWTAAPYAFIPANPQGDIHGNDDFMGEDVRPEDLTDAKLKAVNGSQMLNISHSGLKTRLIKHWLTLQGDETFSSVLNDIFLKRPGLGDPRFFTYDQRSATLAGRHGQLTEHNADLYKANPAKPYLIAAGTVDATVETQRPKLDGKFMIEMTPHYVAFPSPWTGVGEHRGVYGGYSMAALGYDTKYHKNLTADTLDVRWKRPGQRFTLSDMIAISGAAPSSAFYKRGTWYSSTLGGLTRAFGLPELRHPPLRSYPGNGKEIESRTFPHADGGNLEKSAVRPLLARKANRIIAFMNSPKRLGGIHFLDSKLACQTVPSGNFEDVMDGSLVSLFVEITDKDGDRTKPLPVIENGAVEVRKLYTALLQDKKAGRPLVHCGTYNIIARPKFGIPAARNVKICWVYLDGSKDWLNRLPAGSELATAIRKHPDRNSLLVARFRRFPNYRTFGEQNNLTDLQVIDLSKKQTNALSHLTAWSLQKSAGDIRTYLSLPQLSADQSPTPL